MIEKLTNFICVAHPKKKSGTRNEGMGTFALKIPKDNTKLPLSLEY